MKSPHLILKSSRKVAIVYRIHTDQAVQAAHTLVKWLKEKDYSVYTAPEQKHLKGTQKMRSKKDLSSMALLIVLGGDGTYLRAVRLLSGLSVPILGFNMGSLGFLTNHPVEEMCEVVGKTLQNKMSLQARSMLFVEVYRKSKRRGQFYALNDVVIERGFNSQIINTAVYIENKLVSEVKADGLIISSPTGSTAYNLAAGGPILDPEVKAIVVTPVAAHALTSRPLIFPDHKSLAFKMEGKPQEGYLIVDGQRQMEISNADEITVKRAESHHWLVRAPTHNFYHLLREKLKFGDRS